MKATLFENQFCIKAIKGLNLKNCFEKLAKIQIPTQEPIACSSLKIKKQTNVLNMLKKGRHYLM